MTRRRWCAVGGEAVGGVEIVPLVRTRVTLALMSWERIFELGHAGSVGSL